MHEFSLMADLLKKINELATEQKASRVVGVTVKLGALAHISPSHFRDHFTSGTQGTLADGARLEVNVSQDQHDPNAMDVLLESIEVG